MSRPNPGLRPPRPHKLARMRHPSDHAHLCASLSDPSSLPDSVDMSSRPAYDQGQSASCTCHAVAKGVEIISSYRGSMHCLYSLSGELGGDESDSGRELVDVLTVAREVGVAPYEGPSPDGRVSDIWTSNDTGGDPAGNVCQPVTLSELYAAKEHVYESLGQTTIDPSASDLSVQARACLAAGHPLVVGVRVGRAFETLAGSQVAVPDPASDPDAGGHALLVVGYRTMHDDSIQFRVENSWGETWDDAGECWASLAWLASCDEIHPLIHPVLQSAEPSPSWWTRAIASARLYWDDLVGVAE